MKLVSCWGSPSPPQPTIRLQLHSAHGVFYHSFLVDTAFSGYLSLQKEAIDELGLEFIGKSSLAQYFEVEVSVYICEAWVVTPEGKQLYQLARKSIDDRLELLEETVTLRNRPRTFIPIIEYPLPLVGLSLLSQGNWLLIGADGTFCLISSEEPRV